MNSGAPLRVLFAVATLTVASFGTSAEEEPSRRSEGTLVFDGVPSIPDELNAQLLPYNKVRSAWFQDWRADGSMLILTAFGNIGQLHTIETAGGARTQLTFAEESVANAVARPASDQFLFMRDTGGDQNYQAYLGTSESNAVRITEESTRNEKFVFSRDGGTLVWARLTPGDPNADILVLSPDDLSTRRVALEGSGSVSPLDIAPDNRRVLIERRVSSTDNRYLLLDLDSSEVTPILPDTTEASFRNGRFSVDGRRILMTIAQRGGFQKLVMLELASGSLTALLPKAEWDVELFDVAPDGRRLAYSLNVDGFSRVWLMDMHGLSEKQQIPVPDGMIFELEFSPNGEKLAIGMSTATGGDVWSWDAVSGLSRWTLSELGGLDRSRLVNPVLVRYPTFDDRSIPAFVYRPMQTNGKPTPVIISIHGGPEAQERTWFNTQYQFWVAELGATVIAPNIRGSRGYGNAYLSLDDGMLRGDAIRDIDALLDWIATRPDLDSDRVVVYGESYGGFMALSSLARYSDRLAGAIDVVGISNFVTYLTNTEGYRRNRRRAEYGDERDPEMREFLHRISPSTHAAKMDKPLLVIAGANDVRVPVSESKAIVEQVRANGGEAWLLVARDEGHGFSKRSNQLAQAKVQTVFLRRLFGMENSDSDDAEN